MWADKREHLYFSKFGAPIIPNQIMGHTPVKTVERYDNFIFIDTHSTYRDGSEYGDKSYLIWEDDHFDTIYGESKRVD